MPSKGRTYLLPQWMTQDYLWSIFDYDEKSGELIWRYNPEKGKIWNARWPGKPAGTRVAEYVQVKINYVNYMAHRIIFFMHTGKQPPEIDHRDTKKRNNRLRNLRAAGFSTNKFNKTMQSNNTSGYKGVSYIKKNNKWMAMIKSRGVRLYLGSFDTAELASAAYEKAAKKYHGSYHRL